MLINVVLIGRHRWCLGLFGAFFHLIDDDNQSNP